MRYMWAEAVWRKGLRGKFYRGRAAFALDYVHMKERKLYLTVNTLVKQSEIDNVYDFLLPFYRQGLDGVIVQDLVWGQ